MLFASFQFYITIVTFSHLFSCSIYIMTAIQPTVSFLLGSTIIYFDSASIAYYKIMSGYYGFFLIQAKIVFITVYSFIEMPVFNLCFFFFSGYGRLYNSVIFDSATVN